MRSFIVVLVAGLLFQMPAIAHPGSGIVTDREGNVYFVDTGSGVWKIGKDGTLTKLSAPAYHWMTFDEREALRGATLPSFSRGDAVVSRDSRDPRILVSSDFPIATGPDGSLYYPWSPSGTQLQLFHISPSGKTTSFATLPAESDGAPLRWLNGICVSDDGSIYYSERRSIRMITAGGTVRTVATNVGIDGCEPVPGVESELGPYLRGLDVDSNGTVYVAATGCKAVIKITADKKTTVILRAEGSWSPTGVAVSGDDLYVLEYFHTPGDNRVEWLPRVRKVSSDGTVVTVAQIKR